MVKIIFINKDIGRQAQFSLVQGHSGKTYATGTINKLGYHESSPLSIEEYDVCIEDVMRNCHRPLCRWMPKVVVTEDITADVVPPEQTSAIASTEPTPPPLPIPAGINLSKTPFFLLQKIARDKGVNPNGMKKPEIIKAILAAN
jgi:hypothetical protein